MLGLNTWLRVPNFLIATTLAAFATSSPEFTVSTMAAVAGQPEIGLGDALGSNLMNGMAIVGVAASIHPIRAPLGGIAVTLAFGLACVLAMLPYQGVVPRRRGLLLLLALYGASSRRRSSWRRLATEAIDRRAGAAERPRLAVDHPRSGPASGGDPWGKQGQTTTSRLLSRANRGSSPDLPPDLPRPRIRLVKHDRVEFLQERFHY